MDEPNTWAKATVRNEWGSTIRNVRLHHRYEHAHEEEKSWASLEDAEEGDAFDVGYWTGFLSTGYDYWFISFEADGKLWTCKDNFYCFLTGDDAGQTVVCRVYREGGAGKMEVACPKSSKATVGLASQPASPATPSQAQNPHCARCEATGTPEDDQHLPALPAKHLSIQDAIKVFSQRVNPSRSTDPKVTENGQFYWAIFIRHTIESIIDEEFGKDPELKKDPSLKDRFKALLNACHANRQAEIDRLTKDLAATVHNSRLLTMLGPSPPKTTSRSLWNALNASGTAPSPAEMEEKYARCSLYQSVRNTEKMACGDTASLIISRFYKQGGFGYSKPPGAFGTALAMTDTDRSKPPEGKKKRIHYVAMRHYAWTRREFRDPDTGFLVTKDVVKGDLVKYIKIDATMARIRDLIDRGAIIHARVLSGVNNGEGLSKAIEAQRNKSSATSPHPISVVDEHSIVIVGYDVNKHGATEFAFWDPDPLKSAFTVQGENYMAFAKLFFPDGQKTGLSTAEAEEDLYVDDDGNEVRFSHRYQVLTVSTV